jgi:hypothetical protein
MRLALWTRRFLFGIFSIHFSDKRVESICLFVFLASFWRHLYGEGWWDALVHGAFLGITHY